MLDAGGVVRMQLAFGAWWVLLAGCSNEATSSGDPEDAGPVLAPPECTADRPCAENRLCLSGHCYPACSADQQCSTREQCVFSGGQRGACLARPDAGPTPDPCAGKACFGATPICHPTAGLCVACSSDEHCGPDAPICDRGRGVCTARSAGLCAPCAVNADCASGAAVGVAVTCVAIPMPREQVCLQSNCSSDAECPAAFECLPSLRVCTPRRGTCTAYRAAEAARVCATEADCSALDVATGSPQSGVCHQARCAYGCVATPDCPGSRVCAPPVCELEP